MPFKMKPVCKEEENERKVNNSFDILGQVEKDIWIQLLWRDEI